MTKSLDNSASPFHPGEHQVQQRLGVRDQIERFGRRVIRDHMPQQHRDFYHQLPYIFVGHADQQGWPWASILFNQPGFISSPDDKSLRLQTTPVPGDPLNKALKPNAALGLLGIELSSRRRNRLAAHIQSVSANSINLSIDQAFGNCPQYIQSRTLTPISAGEMPKSEVKTFDQFSQQQQGLIQTSDTFFVASHVDHGSDAASEGADVSHHGGQPGFVRVDNPTTLTIPDYAGNNHFNTLGNFVDNAKAGLLFLDFTNGHLLSLTGTVEILWDDEECQYFEGAQRLWRFHLDHGFWIKNGLPLRGQLEEFSANSLLTGTWQQAEKLRQAEAQRDQWLPYEVTKVVEQSSVIKSFYLTPQGFSTAAFKAGQFLTVKLPINGKDVVRTYTVSNAPGEDNLRISIKQEAEHGVFSNHAHKQLTLGDTILAKAPSGCFTFDSTVMRPAVLLAAGVGITPMVAMARQALMEGVRSRYIRPLTLISAASNAQQRAFFDELESISAQSSGQIRSYWALSQTSTSQRAGVDYHHKGRISAELLQGILAIDNYQFYLCGPAAFMQSMYNMLRKLGVDDNAIFAEAFGPAALTRDSPPARKVVPVVPPVTEAIIKFSHSQVEQAWSKADGNLLDFSESHGLSPDSGCRSGNCGSCKTKLISGKITYSSPPSFTTAADEVLLCCALPASEDISIDL